MKRTFKLLIGVFVLLASVTAILTITDDAQAADLYVGPSETYTTIQSAINAAAPGDMIYVTPDTYPENLEIDTPGITLHGPNSGVPGYSTSDRVAEALIISNYSSPVFWVHADNVTISGFKVNYTGGDRAVFLGAETVWTGTSVHGKNIMFSDNIVETSSASAGAVWLERTSDCQVNYNKIVTSCPYGIMITAETGSVNWETDGNFINNNVIDTNGTAGPTTGISIVSRDSTMHWFNNTYIYENDVMDSKGGSGLVCSLNIHYARGGSLMNGPIAVLFNSFGNGTDSLSYAQVKIDHADNISFGLNALESIGQISIFVNDCPTIDIMYNEIVSWASADYTIMLQAVRTVNFGNNDISVHPNNTTTKMTIWTMASPDSELVFSYNTIDIEPVSIMTAYYWDGLYFSGTSMNVSISDNRMYAHERAGLSTAVAFGTGAAGMDVSIERNVLTGFWTDIMIASQDASNRFEIHNNSFVGAQEYGISVYTPIHPEVFDASLNWWGDVTGPSGTPWANGTGKYIQYSIEYRPWLNAPGGRPVTAVSTTGILVEGMDFASGNAIGINASLTGPGVIYLMAMRFDSNPGQWYSGNGLGAFYDVYLKYDYVDTGTMEVRFAYDDSMLGPNPSVNEEGLVAYWSNGGGYIRCSDTGVNVTGHYVWARITESSYPSFSDLTGTMFTIGSPFVTLSDTNVLPGQRVLIVDAGGFDPNTTLTTVWDDAMLWTLNIRTNETGRMVGTSTFMVPQAYPGTHGFKLIEMMGETNVSVDMTVDDDSPLVVSMDVGALHFRGEQVQFIVTIALNGEPSDAAIDPVLIMPDNSDMSLSGSVTNLMTGTYRISYTIPVNAQLGDYALRLKADVGRHHGLAATGFVISVNLTGMSSQIVSAVIADLHPMIESVKGDTATLRTDVGDMVVSLSQLDANVTEVRGNVVTVHTSLGYLTGNVTSMDGKVAQVQTSLGTLSADVSAANKNISAVQTKANGIDTMTLVGIILIAVMAILIIAFVFIRTKK